MQPPSPPSQAFWALIGSGLVVDMNARESLYVGDQSGKSTQSACHLPASRCPPVGCLGRHSNATRLGSRTQHPLAPILAVGNQTTGFPVEEVPTWPQRRGGGDDHRHSGLQMRTFLGPWSREKTTETDPVVRAEVGTTPPSFWYCRRALNHSNQQQVRSHRCVPQILKRRYLVKVSCQMQEAESDLDMALD